MISVNKWLVGLGLIFLVGCSTEPISEAEARELARQAFQEFLLRKNLSEEQYKEPRIRYRPKLELWEIDYAWKVPGKGSNSVNIGVDINGFVELHAEHP